jgi:pseudaminic acid cytidylyltransferase
MIVAVIPARGGSKRIPRKNIREFCGKPMIAWSIAAARESGLFDRIIVSTDDEEIAEVARQSGADTPFVRPEELSDDMTGTTPVIRHAVDWVEANDGPVEYVCCLYATAPFVDGETLRRGFGEIRAAGTDFALAVTTFSFPIQRALRIAPSGLLEPLSPGSIKSRSQDLEETWHDAGHFFWTTPGALSADIAELLSRAAPVRIPRHLVQDIDTEEDWTRAELMFRTIQKD